MKVLFDSNILVSDAVFKGAATRAINATVDARWKIFVSEFILAETGRVLREKFGRGTAFRQATIQMLREVCVIAEEPVTKHRVPGDPDDTPILRAALGAGVDYLVTRDAELLALNPVEGVRIIPLAEYLHILESHGFARD